MPTKIKEVKRPRGLLRLGFRVPILLFRLHPGWIMGERFLLLIHSGRKSGMPRQTILEVFQHDKTNDMYYVFAGWGEQSDWVRNIEQTPDVTIIVGVRHLQAYATRVSPEALAHMGIVFAFRPL